MPNLEFERWIKTSRRANPQCSKELEDEIIAKPKCKTNITKSSSTMLVSEKTKGIKKEKFYKR